ncbi:hypothetical protein [Nesterenkonia sp. NBAIMH1]|uniref:hypothetical protein n=1 Tax=Nesterenkonia sp. NBAIMH1 TaxID=2600320 RepID=UPI0011B52E76|nr:hypothetical protein [Nesterenkonia sp. NBAIMH1]
MSETQQPYEPQGQRPANHWSSTEPTSSRPAWLLPVLVLGALVVLAGGVMVAIVGWLLLGGDDEPQPEAVGDEQEAEAQDDEAEGEPADQSPTPPPRATCRP